MSKQVQRVSDYNTRTARDLMGIPGGAVNLWIVHDKS